MNTMYSYNNIAHMFVVKFVTPRSYQCLQIEKFITQLCLQIRSGGMVVLLASP